MKHPEDITKISHPKQSSPTLPVDLSHSCTQSKDTTHVRVVEVGDITDGW